MQLRPAMHLAAVALSLTGILAMSAGGATFAAAHAPTRYTASSGGKAAPLQVDSGSTGTALTCGGTTALAVAGLTVSCGGAGAQTLAATVSAPACDGTHCVVSVDVKPASAAGASGAGTISGVAITRAGTSKATAAVTAAAAGGTQVPLALSFSVSGKGAAITDVTADQPSAQNATVTLTFAPPAGAAPVAIPCGGAAVTSKYLTFKCTTQTDASLIEATVMPATCVGNTCTQPVEVALNPRVTGTGDGSAFIIYVDLEWNGSSWMITIDVVLGGANDEVAVAVTPRKNVTIMGATNTLESPTQAIGVMAFQRGATSAG